MTPSAANPLYLNTGGTAYGSHAHGLVTKCPRLYGYVRVMGLRFPPNAGQFMGTLLHVALAHHYTREAASQPGGVVAGGVRVTDPDHVLTPESAVIRAAHDAEKDLNVAWDGPTDEDIDLTLQALAAYIDRWSQEEQGQRILGVECEVRAEIPDSKGNLRPYTQRIDLAVRDRLGRVWYRDHKRLARGNGATLRYQMDRQFLTMRAIGMAKHNDKFAGVTINLVKPTTKAGRTTFDFDRPSPKPSHHALFRVWEDTAQWKEFLDWIVSRWGGRPKDVWNWPQADNGEICVGPFGVCPAFDLCTRGPHGIDPRYHLPAEAIPDL